MNAVLYCSPGGIGMNGSLVNAFEYFIAIYEHNPDVRLYWLKMTQNGIDQILEVMENRYDLSGLEGFKDNIIPIGARDLIKIQFKNLLVLDYITIFETRGLIRADNLVVISEKKTEDPNYFYRKDWYNVTYYGEMPFHYKDRAYRMKLWLHRFKPLRYVKEGIYINAPFTNPDTFNPMEKKSIRDLNLPDKPILLKSGKHLDNLFENFDTYVYYHANKWFDPHPRLFIECTFYGKEIYYLNDFDIRDGSYYRYNDVIKNGIQYRDLDENDEIVRMFI